MGSLNIHVIPVKTEYLLTSIPELIKITCFLKWAADEVLLFHWITGLCKQGRVVWKRVDANPRLKINRITNFSCIQMSLTAFVFCILRLFKHYTEIKQYTEILIAKLQNSNQISLIPGQLNWSLNRKLQELHFQAWLDLYIKRFNNCPLKRCQIQCIMLSQPDTIFSQVGKLVSVFPPSGAVMRSN